MNKEKFVECERNRLKKILNFRLPTYFRPLGIAIFIAAFVLMFIRLSFPEYSNVLREIARKGLVIGMLMASLARDKEEDEMTIKLRAQSYAIAFIVGVIYALIMPYVEYGVSNVISPGDRAYKELGDFQILTFMLIIQLMFYHTLKRYR